MRPGVTARTLLAVAAAVVTLVLGADHVRAAFPGANGRIVFAREDNEVWTILPDGTGEINLTDSPTDDDAASWSPDGTRIVFSSDRDGSPDIWVMNADGSNLRQVTEGPDDDDHPAWSPDGNRIVFSKEEDGDNDVYIVNVDGSGLTNLTDTDALDEGGPAWSPDGTKIAFDRNREIWVMNTDGSGQTQLYDNGESPNWSPDGTRIAFDSDDDGDREIVVMNADGSGRTQITFNAESDRLPAWSPDGTKIVFQATRGEDDQIHVIDAGGGNEVAVTNATNPDDDREPDWQPLSVATTTTTIAGSTTTTLPGGERLAGRKLLLRDNAEKPAKRALVLLAKDRAVGAGAENGGAGDAVLHGGFLRVVSSTGDGFNTTYDLPAERWRYRGKQGRNKGYKLKGAGPIRSISLKLGKSVKIVAKGDALGHSLGADPAPVHVAVGLGAQRYCFTFGGQTRFKAGKTYVAKKAPAPTACAAFVPACGDRLLEASESCPTLEGPGDGLAVDAVSTYFASIPIPDAANDIDASGRPLVRTRIEIVFLATTRVSELNALLARLGARISSMLAGIRSVVVDIPDPGSVAALDALVAEVEADPIVEMVLKAYEPELEVLPSNFPTPLDATAGPQIDHHLTVRAAAAWNARAATQFEPTVVVLDGFGDGAPDSALAAIVPAQDFAAGSPDDHGYHVAGIIAASFDGDGTARGRATGMMPGTTQMRVVDRENAATSYPDELNLTLEALAAGAPHGILNTSLGVHCNEPFQELVDDAWWWAYKVRLLGLEDRVLHLTAAGNIRPACPGETAAEVASRFAAAALAPLPVANLTNVLVVENAINGAGPAFTPRCLEESSKTRGHLAGIGTDVWSLTGATAGAGNLTGTSMATPQVAGLAAYLWALDDALSVQDLRSLLIATARPVPGSGGLAPCSALDPAPVIDAYAAVLALDAASLPTPATAPIRLAILDVDGNGAFNATDLASHAFKLLDDAGNLEEPMAPDFGRNDLNGDGFTGGANRRTSFDLDRVGSTRYGASQLGQVFQTIDGLELAFDETALNDLDILCYYAYSDLYTGDEELRRTRLGVRHCAGITMDVSFPDTIPLDAPETLRVTVTRTGPGGSLPVPDVHIELSTEGGTAVPSLGLTDAQGEFSAQVELAPSSTEVTVLVQARFEPGGDVFADETVDAEACGRPFGELPDGSYLRTCRGCSVGGPILTCECERESNLGFVGTSIEFVRCRKGFDITNVDGVLKCTACEGGPTTTTNTFPTSSTSSTSTSTSSTTSSTATIPTTSSTASTAATTSTTSSTTTTTIFAFPVVPYARYAASGPHGPSVTLADEFVTETVDLGAVALELPPVEIDGVSPPDPDTHQTCHAHPGGVLDTCVDVQDAFETAPLRIGAPVALCVPELLPFVPVDAFKCYAASGTPLDREVQLVDEFQSRMVTVGAPDLFCTPVEVNDEPLVISTRYLVCYATTPSGTAGGSIQVENVLHAGPIQVDVGVPTGVCVPAVRQLVQSCQLCGNGVLDGDEECDDGGIVGGDGCSAVCRFDFDCTCDGTPVPPPDHQRCQAVADCSVACSACTAGGGVCGCE